MIDLVQHRTRIGLFGAVTSRSSKKRNTKLSFKTVKNILKSESKKLIKPKTNDVKSRTFLSFLFLTVVLCSFNRLNTNTKFHQKSDIICGSQYTSIENLNVYGICKCLEHIDYGNVRYHNDSIVSVNHYTLSHSDVIISNTADTKCVIDNSIDLHGSESEYRLQLPSDINVEYSLFVYQRFCNGTVMMKSLQMCQYPGTCCYLLGNKGMHCYNGNPPTEVMQATVKTWRKENIYKTKSVIATQEKSLSQGCVCVVGVPGAGKSTAIHHAALNLENDGFVIYCIDKAKEFLDYYDENKKQVFIFDDILGIYSLIQGEVDFWDDQNDEIRSILGTKTKLLVSIRTQLYNQVVKDNDFVFLENSTCIDFNDKAYRLDAPDMIAMLKFYLPTQGVDNVDDLIRDIYYYGYTEKELQDMKEEERHEIMTQTSVELIEFCHCFPLLCKVFCSEEFARHNPRKFFENPFQALTQICQNIKSENKLQFCGLVLCTVLDGKLTEDMFDINCELDDEVHKQSVTLRNVIMASCDLEGEEFLPQVESALNSLDGVYVTHIENTYKMKHRVFHDAVTYLFNATQPLFVLKYGTRQFIRDRIRLSKSQYEDDPYMIIINDEKNIERLADRLFEDLVSDPRKGVEFIASNVNMGDVRLFSCLRNKLLNRKQTDKTLIDKLFRQCMLTAWLHSHQDRDTHKHGNVNQFKLIELCVKTGVDCNLYVDVLGRYPLHISVMTGSLKLTELLLNNGADKRRIEDWGGYSVLQVICRETKYNKLDMFKLLIEHGGDRCVVQFITSDGCKILQGLEDDTDRQSILPQLEYDSDRHRILKALDSNSLQLEEVLPDKSIKILTSEKHEIKQYVEHCEGRKIQLVINKHDNLLTYVDWPFHKNILHLSVDDYVVTKYLLTYPCLQQDINNCDAWGRNAYWYVVNNKIARDGGIEDVVVEDKEKMIKLYKKYGAILYDNNDDGTKEEKVEVIYDQTTEGS